VIPLSSFDPDQITKEDCRKLANHLDEYLMLLEEVMIFPKEMKKKDEKKMKDAIQLTKKLIKKLRKGDTSVFKDADELDDY
jgi:hypothetical protein